MRIAPPVELNGEQRTELERWARQRSLPARVVERARIVLQAAAGLENQQIAQRMGVTPKKVARAGGNAFSRVVWQLWRRTLRDRAEHARLAIAG